MIKVVFLRDKRSVEIDAENVSEVFSKLSILKEQYVVIKNGRIICEDEPLSEGDKLELFTVASGG